MKDENDSSPRSYHIDNLTVHVSWDGVKSPGFSSSSRELQDLKKILKKQLDIFFYKRGKECLWVSFIGGTGTGKSTLFNALCGTYISGAGVERPKTEGPVVYIHKKNSIEEGFPFPDFHISYFREKEHGTSYTTGMPGNFEVVQHDRDEMSHVVLVDTPDVDSREIKNRQITEGLYLLSDFIVFVTSQEKYADEVPSKFLFRIQEEGKPYFFLLNKGDALLKPEEIIMFYREYGLKIPDDHFGIIPYIPSPSFSFISRHPGFNRFSTVFSEMLGKGNFSQIIQNEEKRSARELEGKISTLLHLLEEESDAAEKWLSDLSSLFEESEKDLFEQLKNHYKKDTLHHLQHEIKKIYKRYDILAKPRHYVSQFLLMPFRLLGLKKRTEEESHTRDLLKAGKRVDVSPVQAAIDRLNRRVLEQLSPADEDSSLYDRLRQADMVFSADEVRSRIWEEQEKLAYWLEETFQELARGISKGKELGIYSTSILWGVFILSFEVVLGGGISLLEAALDTFLAPLVTRSSVELFAYNEIKEITHEMNKRYKAGLLSIVDEQRNRYKSCLVTHMPGEEIMKDLQSLKEMIGGMK